MVNVTRVVGGVTDAVPADRKFKIPHEPTDGQFVVGVIDTGFIEGSSFDWLDHVDFDDDAVDPVLARGILHPDDGHGTFVTGLILQEAPRAKVKMLRAIDADTDNAKQGNDQAVADAIRKLGSDPRVKIISLSFFGGPWEDAPPPRIEIELRALRWRPEPVVVVAAAGNHPTDRKVWPGAFKHVIAVGAVDESSRYLQGSPPPKASFSNHGGWVDAYANGVHALGPFLRIGRADEHPAFDGSAFWSGTSFAAATVAGRIAQVAMDEGIDARRAAAWVLSGPRLSDPHTSPKRWPAYVQGVKSDWRSWPVSTLTDSSGGDQGNA